MKLNLEVIASSSIKCQRPWPRIVWIGTEKESLLLVDKARVSVLYIPSGKTKQKIPQLSNIIAENICLNTSANGGDLVGVQKSGEVFVWRKDLGILKTICGLSSLLNIAVLSHGPCQVFASNGSTKILVVINYDHFFLWLHDAANTYLEGKDHTLVGRWIQLDVGEGLNLPGLNNREAFVNAIFASNSLLGDCCELSVTFNSGVSLTVCSGLIRFTPPESSKPDRYPTIDIKWKCLQYPLRNISPGCEAITIHGSYITRYSHDASILAIAVNQKSPADTSMLYVSSLTDTLLLSKLWGCGVREPKAKRGKQYWVADMAWTSDDLFLACILANGSVALLSRLGEPLIISTHGCSVEMGPALFLALHPLIMVQSENRQGLLEDKDFELSSNSAESMRQMFSVSSHPKLPILVFSDGYMVTFAQIPSDINSFFLMRSLVLESSKQLQIVGETQNLILTLADAYNLPAIDEQTKLAARKPRLNLQDKQHFSFEELERSLSETIDSEVSLVISPDAKGRANFGAVQNMNSGKIFFGESDMLQTVSDAFELSGQKSEAEKTLLKSVLSAKHALLSVWKVAASATEAWTANMDDVMKRAVENFVKLFSVILDCPQVSEALENQQHVWPLPAVQTASLFQVISLFRYLLEVAQFDALQQHLAPIVLQLVHRTILTILESRTLQESDPRLKTLSGCFTLLKFTEKTLSRLYLWLPKSVKIGRITGDIFEPSEVPIEMQDNKENRSSPERKDGHLLSDSGQLVAKRLAGSWKALYKAVLAHQELAVGQLEQQRTRQLLFTIQQNLQAINASIPQISAIPISKGDRLSLDGMHTQAVDAWKDQLRRYKETGRENHAAKLLHSLLYTHLLRLDLQAAVEFIDNLVVKADVESALSTHSLTDTPPIQPSFMTFVTNTLKSQAFQEPDMVPCIRSQPIRQVVQTLARFMVAYFTNQIVYIFPPHNPQPLPAIHFQTNIINKRILPKSHEEISTTIRREKLSGIWTLERAMEYLLLSGLVCEAVWFADQMGNWKTAFQLATACTLHRTIAPNLYQTKKKLCKPLLLPHSLKPDEILYNKLAQLAGSPHSIGNKADVLIDSNTDLTQLTATLQDVMLAGVMSFVEVVPSLLALLISRLKSLVQKFNPLVPAEFYLPAPPIFCPQPTTPNQVNLSSAVQDEITLRHEAASLVQLTLAVMNAAHVSIPSLRWYIRQLAQMQPKAVQFKSNTEGPCQNFPDVLLEQLPISSEFEEIRGNRSIHSVLCSFRDLCSLLWLLHARDNLSINLRKREKLLSEQGYQNYEKIQLTRVPQSEWINMCWLCLRWTSHLLPFSRFLSDEASLHKVFLSMLLEMPASMQVADLLAEFFHDNSNAHPDMQERLDKILSDWQSIIVKPEEDERPFRALQEDVLDGRKSVSFHGTSPRGESLSIYFYKQQQVARRVLKKKEKCFGAYEEFTFSQEEEPLKMINIGSRPFETKFSYFDFLDTFCAVSFSKVLDKLQSEDKISTSPLLKCLCKNMCKQEINYFVEHIAAKVHKGQGLAILCGSIPRNGHFASQDDAPSDSRPLPQSASRPAGLFRSGIRYNHSPERIHAAVMRDSASNTLKSKPMSSRQQRMIEQANQHWHLMVNFGKKYTGLQQLLEWLEVWCNRRHKFGLGNYESALELKPSVKLQIPAQLIVLSLWLLENKYTKTTGRDKEGNREFGISSSHQRSDNAVHKSASLGPQNNDSKQIFFERQRDKSRSPTHSPAAPEPQESAQVSQRSTLREEEEVRTAYEQVLDNPEDNSSVIVSSLASDELPEELQQTQNILRGTESATRAEVSGLNHQIFIEKIQSPFERPSTPTPAPHSSTPTPRSRNGDSISNSNRSVSISPNPKARHMRYNAASVREDIIVGPNEGGLADLLQNVIRKEMRRIVQIQQQSLTVMMGAIDGETDADQSIYRPPIPRDHIQQNRQQSRGDNSNMRYALAELHNLQQQQVSREESGSHLSGFGEDRMFAATSAKPLLTAAQSLSRVQADGNENMAPGLDGPPRFLQIPTKREYNGFKLPQIPLPQAWKPMNFAPNSEDIRNFPLLKIVFRPSEPIIYRPPQPTPAYFTFRPPLALISEKPSQPRPLNFSHVPQLIPPPSKQDASTKSGFFGIPLLRFSTGGLEPNSQESLFGRLVPPQYLSAHQQEEAARKAHKERHLQAFREELAEVERAARDLEKNAAPDESSQPDHEEEKSKVEGHRAHKTSVAHKLLLKKAKEAENISSAQKQSSMEHKHPVSSELDARDGPLLEEDAESSVIHDGYAISPGIFDGYQHMEQQLGVDADPETRFQYKLAQALQRQLQIEKERWLQQRKVDFATNTRDRADVSVDVRRSFESMHTAEAATSITKDTGVDPVHEAVAEYNRTRQGITVPPDIFMGLRFGDIEQKDQTFSGRGRAFINVVDVRASTVLRDIPERDQEKSETDARLKPSSYSMRQTSAQEIDAIEESLRQQLEPVQRRGHDAVTVQVFERRTPGSDRLSVALLPRGSTQESKTAFIQRLRTMNDQMSAIDEMSRNIENEFQSSKMLLETLQSMNHSRYLGEQQDTGQVPSLHASTDTLTPKMSAGSPSHSARMSAKSPGLSSYSKKSEASRSDLSALTDISDIIGEVLADGGIDLMATGLTHDEANKMIAKAQQRRMFSPLHSPSMDALKHAVKASESRGDSHSPERRDIRQWMTEKFAERQNEYKKQRSALQEREHSPFKSASEIHAGSRSLQALMQEKERMRKMRGEEYMHQRILEAEYLIGSAITETVPVTQDKSRSRSVSPRSKSRSHSRSSARSSLYHISSQPSYTSSRAPYKPTQVREGRRRTRIRGRGRERRPLRSESDISPFEDRSRDVMESTYSITSPPKSILKVTQSGSQINQLKPTDSSEYLEDRLAVDSSTDLQDYLYAVQDFEGSGELATSKQNGQLITKPEKVYKPKSFKDLVRLQRPEITRQQAVTQPPPEKYVQQVLAKKAAQRDELAKVKKASQTQPLESKRSNTEESSRKAYAPLQMPPGLRKVKTYAERLQELKPKMHYASPIIPRQHVLDSVSTRARRSAFISKRHPTGPYHKPVTYVEQLQKINAAAASASKRRGKPTRPLAATKTRMPARALAHTPKTYTQQLQELSAPYKKTFRSASRPPSSLSSSRPRPYGDPYRVASEEALSVLSDWSVDENVRRLIYEDGVDNNTDASVSVDHLMFAPSEAGASDYYDIIMGGGDYDLGDNYGDLGEDYRESVDVNELERIADGMSVGSGSVLSVIDWDAVDKLIEDV